MHGAEQQKLGWYPSFLTDALRQLLPDSVWHANQFPRDNGCVPATIAEHDGTYVNVVVNSSETFLAVRITAHRQSSVGGRRDVNLRGACLERGAFARKWQRSDIPTRGIARNAQVIMMISPGFRTALVCTRRKQCHWELVRTPP